MFPDSISTFRAPVALESASVLSTNISRIVCSSSAGEGNGRGSRKTSIHDSRACCARYTSHLLKISFYVRREAMSIIAELQSDCEEYEQLKCVKSWASNPIINALQISKIWQIVLNNSRSTQHKFLCPDNGQKNCPMFGQFFTGLFCGSNAAAGDEVGR